MDTFDADVIKTLELLAYKTKQIELYYSSRGEQPFKEDPPEFTIYEDDLSPLKMTRYSILPSLDFLEKEGYIIISSIYDPNLFDHQDIDHEDVINGVLRIRLFNILIFKGIDDLLERYKRGIEPFEKITKTETKFNDSESILVIDGTEIKIARQDKETNEHKILKYLFITNKENIKDYSQFAEIAEEEFGDPDYPNKQDSWKRYHAACKSINQKIKEETKGKIDDFLMFNTGKTAKVRVSPKYIT